MKKTFWSLKKNLWFFYKEQLNAILHGVTFSINKFWIIQMLEFPLNDKYICTSLSLGYLLDL